MALTGPDRPVLRRNDWTPLQALTAGVRPRLSVSVVIPAYGGQDRLDLVLAALAAQTYPAHLLQVLVVDDGSSPALRLPGLRPEHCRLVRAPESGWGRAHACHTGALAAEGEVLHWLDADMLAFPDHVEQQLRWHHLADHLVTIGYKRLVGTWSLTPEQVHREATEGRLPALFPAEQGLPHVWVEQLIDASDGLRTADGVAFRAAVGATGALHRELYLSSGGMDTVLRLGEDSELGYRLAQRGAVFVPVPDAGSWHLGIPNATANQDAVRRYNWPYLANRMPLPRFRRWQARRLWPVPYVEVVVDATAAGYESVTTCVDAVLSGTLTDARVVAVAPWSRLADDPRTPPLAGTPDGELRLLREHLSGDPRVQLVEQVADSPFPATFRLELHPDQVLGRTSLEQLVAAADRARAGLVEVATTGGSLRLWRTAALERARRVRPGEPEAEVVAQVWGRTAVPVRELGIQAAAALEHRDRRLLLGRAVPLTGWSRLTRLTRALRPSALHRHGGRLLRRARTALGDRSSAAAGDTGSG
jgi:GT2 family glycosyltransferase